MYDVCVAPVIGDESRNHWPSVVEAAGLVVSRKQGRVRRCYLNAVPIVELAQRWIDDFGARASGGLLALKSDLERKNT